MDIETYAFGVPGILAVLHSSSCFWSEEINIVTAVLMSVDCRAIMIAL